MSAGQTTPKYRVYRCLEQNGAETFEVRDCTRYSLPVDYFRSLVVAEYWRDQLNAGRVHVDPHAVIGCRLVAGSHAIAGCKVVAS